MRYLLLIYTNSDNWEHPMYLRDPEFLALPQKERDELVRQSDALWQELMDSGELVVGTPLADPVTSMTVRVRNGVPATTDGPYLESKEQLAGYFVIDCESAERATDIAAHIPESRFAGVEVRPIMGTFGQEM